MLRFARLFSRSQLLQRSVEIGDGGRESPRIAHSSQVGLDVLSSNAGQIRCVGQRRMGGSGRGSDTTESSRAIVRERAATPASPP